MALSMQRKNGTLLCGERAPHNSPLNQLICSSRWLRVLRLYLVHAGMKKGKKKKEPTYAQGCAGLVCGPVFQRVGCVMNICLSRQLSAHLRARAGNQE